MSSGYPGQEWRPPAWMREAACRDLSPAGFFPDREASHAAYREAREACRRCPVREPCLDYALRHRIVHGLWGGRSERERRRLRRVMTQGD